jgi:hypothetical protein
MIAATCWLQQGAPVQAAVERTSICVSHLMDVQQLLSWVCLSQQLVQAQQMHSCFRC